MNRVISLIEQSHLMKRLSIGVFWSLLGNIVFRSLSAVSTIIVGRILGPQGLGEYGLIQSTVQMFSVYAGARMGATSTKYIAQHRLNKPDKAARILKLTLLFSFVTCSLASVGLLVLSPYISEHSLNRPELMGALSIGALIVFFLVYGNVHEYALMGFENFKAVAKVSAVRGVLTPMLCIPFAYLWGVEGALSALVIVAVIVLVQLSILLRKERIKAGFKTHVPLSEVAKELPVVWKYALPGLLIGVLISATMWFGRVVLVQQGDGFSELGLFEAANQWRILVLFLPTILARVMLPILSETHGKTEGDDFSKTVSINIQATCFVTIPIIILAVGFSRQLTGVYGSEFSKAEFILPILMLSVYFVAMNQSARQVYDGSGRRWMNLFIYMVWGTVFFVSYTKLIPIFGAVGFAYSYLMAEVALFIVQAVYIDKFIAPSTLRNSSKVIVFSLLLLTCVFTFHDVHSVILRNVIISCLFLISLVPILNKMRIINIRWL